MEPSRSTDHDRDNSLLTTEHRRYVTGEKSFEEKSQGYESKYPSMVAERVFHGLLDFSLLGSCRDRIDVFQVLNETEAVNENGEYESKRKEWRGISVLDIAPAILTFLVDLTQEFNYGSADWENWFKEAYENVNPEGFAHITIGTIPELDLDRLEERYNGDSTLRNVELDALYQHGRIETAEYIDARQSVEIK